MFPVHRLTCALIRPWRANEVACTNSPHIFLFAYFVLHRQQLFTDEQKPAHEFCAKLGAVCRAACLHPADRWHQKRTVSTHFIPLRQCLPVNFMDLLPLLASTRCSEPCGRAAITPPSSPSMVDSCSVCQGRLPLPVPFWASLGTCTRFAAPCSFSQLCC